MNLIMEESSSSPPPPPPSSVEGETSKDAHDHFTEEDEILRPSVNHVKVSTVSSSPSSLGKGVDGEGEDLPSSTSVPSSSSSSSSLKTNIATTRPTPAQRKPAVLLSTDQDLCLPSTETTMDKSLVDDDYDDVHRHRSKETSTQLKVTTDPFEEDVEAEGEDGKDESLVPIEPLETSVNDPGEEFSKFSVKPPDDCSVQVALQGEEEVEPDEEEKVVEQSGKEFDGQSVNSPSTLQQGDNMFAEQPRSQSSADSSISPSPRTTANTSNFMNSQSSSSSSSSTTSTEQVKPVTEYSKEEKSLSSSPLSKKKDYPDDLNPFGDDDEEEEVEVVKQEVAVKPEVNVKPEVKTPKPSPPAILVSPEVRSYPQDLNPFGDEEEEVEEATEEVEVPRQTSYYTSSTSTPLKSIPTVASSASLNPFGSDDEEEEEEEVVLKTPVKMPPVSPRSPVMGSALSTPKRKKKRPAPPPPTGSPRPNRNDSTSYDSINMISNASSTSSLCSRTPTPTPRSSRASNGSLTTLTTTNSDVNSSLTSGSGSSVSAQLRAIKNKKRPAPPIPAFKRSVQSSSEEMEKELNDIGDELPVVEARRAELELWLVNNKPPEVGLDSNVKKPFESKIDLNVKSVVSETTKLEASKDSNEKEPEEDKDRKSGEMDTAESKLPKPEGKSGSDPEADAKILPEEQVKENSISNSTQGFDSKPVEPEVRKNELSVNEFGSNSKLEVESTASSSSQELSLESTSNQDEQSELKDGEEMQKPEITDNEHKTLQTDTSGSEYETKLAEFIELAKKRCKLARKQKELMYMKREHKLEEAQADIEYQLRVIMSKQDAQKTDVDREKEQDLLSRMMEIIDERNDIIENMIRDENREIEEYQKMVSKVVPIIANQSTTQPEDSSSSKSSSKSAQDKVAKSHHHHHDHHHHLKLHSMLKLHKKDKSKTEKKAKKVKVAKNEEGAGAEEPMEEVKKKHKIATLGKSTLKKLAPAREMVAELKSKLKSSKESSASLPSPAASSKEEKQ